MIPVRTTVCTYQKDLSGSPQPPFCNSFIIHPREQNCHPAHGRVGRATNCRVRGLGFKSPGTILTSRTETHSLSRMVRDGWDPCSVPLS